MLFICYSQNLKPQKHAVQNSEVSPVELGHTNVINGKKRFSSTPCTRKIEIIFTFYVLERKTA